MADDALVARVRWLAVERLGDRVNRVEVQVRDCGFLIAIGIWTVEGWRHLVWARLPMDDVGQWVDAACDALLGWLDARVASGRSALAGP